MITPAAPALPLLIENAALYTPAGVREPGWLLAEGGQIRDLGEGQPPELSGAARRVDAQGMPYCPVLSICTCTGPWATR
jgi:cytosine/adenosine deaminase-related metal-dependent hydrolase